MSFLPDLLSHVALTTGCAGLLYTATVTAAALTALATRVPARRRAAQTVLEILVRRGRSASGSVEELQPHNPGDHQ